MGNIKIYLMLFLSIVCLNIFGQDPISVNPNNSNASISLSWVDNIPRLRIGGTGEGIQNGLKIQGVGDKTFFHVNDGFAQVFNPNNFNAYLGLSWSNNIARLRVGGSGIGSANGFEIQTIGDEKLLSLYHDKNAKFYGFLEAQNFIPQNPNNTNASIGISWLDNTSRIRIEGSGEGTQNGLKIQGVGNKTFFYVNDGFAQVINPNNSNAYLGLSWNSNIARIRIGGSGLGSSNGFEIQTIGDVKLFRISHEGNAAVYGKLEAKEIKVQLAPTADFVFQDDYKLKELKEVELFINQNKHLPDFPSGKEIEQNGINIGEMNAKLLQKIEELTLYTIEQEKRIEELEWQNEKILKLLEEK